MDEATMSLGHVSDNIRQGLFWVAQTSTSNISQMHVSKDRKMESEICGSTIEDSKGVYLSGVPFSQNIITNALFCELTFSL